MARFTTTSLPPPAPKPGVHVARIVRAKEKVSENGNPMLVMTAKFVDSAELGFVITFVLKAAKLVAYFCQSCDLILPNGDGVEVEILPHHVEGRIFYPVVELDGDALEAVPRITRFLGRIEALTANPALAEVKIQPQSPRTLKAVERGSL